MKSPAIDCQAFKDRPVDRDRLVGHPCCTLFILHPVAVPTGGLSGPWPSRFLAGPLLGPPSFALNFMFKFI